MSRNWKSETMAEEERKNSKRGLLPVAVLILLALIYPQLSNLYPRLTGLGSGMTAGSWNYGKSIVEFSWLFIAVALVSILLLEWGRTIKVQKNQVFLGLLVTLVLGFILLPQAALFIFTGIVIVLGLGITGYLSPKRVLPWALRIASTIMTFSFVYLTYQFIISDFSNFYVWQFSSRTLPLVYRISAVWAGQEGTWLLWAWLVLVSSWFVSEKFGWDDSFVRKTQFVTLLVALFFTHMAFLVSPFDMIYEQNPSLTPDFVRNDLPGQGLNPLLQDPWMAVHPPLVFIGYAGVTIPLAAALVFLFTHDKRWEAFARPWNRLAWLFLTLGIAVGGFWSYKVLGWGGYWAWDPVETSSFIPWLTVSGLMHASVMYRRKRTFDYLGPMLAVVSFILVVYATFITRSGLWESVHAFAETTAGPWLAMAILNTIFIYLVLTADYAVGKKAEGGASRTAREVILAFLVAQILMLSYMRVTGEATILIPANKYIPTLAITAILAVALRMRRLKKQKVVQEGASEEEGEAVMEPPAEDAAHSAEAEAEERTKEREFHIISYDNLFYVTVILFFILAFVSFWGITYPMFVQLQSAEKISIGIEFFNRWSFPFTVALFAALALCFVFGRVRKNMLLAGLGATAVVSLAFMAVSPAGSLYSRFFNVTEVPEKWYWTYMDMTMPLILLTLIIVGIKGYDGIKRKNWRILGFTAIHLGAVLTLLGSMFSAAYSEEFHQNYIYPMEVDAPKDIGRGYSIALRGVDMEQTVDGWWATQIVVEVFRNGRPQSVGIAESIDDKKHGRVTHVYIQRGLINDVYVIFQGATPSGGAIVVPLAVKVVPGVSILWLGIVLLSVGILPLLFTKRERGFSPLRGWEAGEPRAPEEPVEVEKVEKPKKKLKEEPPADEMAFLEKSLRDLEENYKRGLVNRETYRSLKRQYKKSLAELDEERKGD
jgi:cytochrome c-type biogenesis protein CcmF